MNTWNRRRFLQLASVSLLAGCANVKLAPPDPRRAAVDDFFGRLQRDLQSDRWHWIAWAISPNSMEMSSVQNRWEERWTERQTVDVQLIPGRILESNGLLNVQVRWHRVVRKRNGTLIKSSGDAEVILEPFENSYRIRQILGQSFL